MMVTAAMDARPPPDGFTRLAASLRIHHDPDRVAALLRDGRIPWALGRVASPDGSGRRRLAIDLRLRLGGEKVAVTTFGKAAFLDLGMPRRTATGWEAEISWLASTAAPLFPVFSGWLTIGREELRIDGLYAPPGGAVGRVADRMLLHVAANATARWVLEEIDRFAREAAA
jgi:hypothetical protein